MTDLNVMPTPSENSGQAVQNCKQARIDCRDGYRKARGLGAHAMIIAVFTCQMHGNGEEVLSTIKMIEEEGSKAEGEAARYLGVQFTGAKKDGTIDKTRQNDAKSSYTKELELVHEMGLVAWHDEKLGKTKVKLSEEEKKAKKAAKFELDAKQWMIDQAKTDPVMSAMLQYGAVWGELAAKNPAQAADQLASDLAHLTKGLGGALRNLEAA